MERMNMLDRLEERAIAHGHQEIVMTLASWRDVVRPAIEREAAQQERERIRTVAEDLLIAADNPDAATRYGHGYNDALRAVLAEPTG